MKNMQLDEANEQNAALFNALQLAYAAIKSLDEGALGDGRTPEGMPYPIRDEVLHNIAKALALVEGNTDVTTDAG